MTAPSGCHGNPRSGFGVCADCNALPSGSERDIIAKADFTERGTGTRHSTGEDELTSVKVELEAVYRPLKSDSK